MQFYKYGMPDTFLFYFILFFREYNNLYQPKQNFGRHSKSRDLPGPVKHDAI